MKRMVIASHGEFANGIVNSLKMIAGSSADAIEVYTMKPGDLADEYAKELEKVIQKHPNDTYIILTDLYGASVCNAMLSLSIYKNVFVVSGVNLNLALALLLENSQIDESYLQSLIEESRKGMKIVSMQAIENEDF
ncbi:PTS system mannose-specific IIA component [Breznakia sp. PF5-3]|uniref:PTS sugar transporter subunit IIA n=1 Tax=unclassified Breznakia TaxID=2623764 RepID=UPI002406056F|nr:MULTISPECIES: hypothetical protein [unclassified Breznakia]MDF9825403.1 PTS system mannose-specific IIA component [Breznakia sp. PM6-1]MDF9836281.1 PTS system mannose-specific IIA component [Breznakia sp. PF5-3]MDF9837567.1 PTS system mannose-specific IIA component [Breznakia sp. PFB2-8]MDF9860180.1 PTS system mannose-specific IIA component [Breznakia sp. PH5-24]